MKHRRRHRPTYRRVVVKLGTSVLTDGSESLNQALMRDLTRQIVHLRHAGYEMLVVTSGAKAAGLERLKADAATTRGSTRQMLSAVGQARLVWHWDRYFAAQGECVGQVLLTRHELEDSTSYLNIQDTLEEMLTCKVVPLINENDVVATPKVRVGDNDSISAMVAVMVRADLLLLLTDQQGLYDRDPRIHPEAQLIGEVPRVDDSILVLAGASSSSLGTGGMHTKLNAAMVAQRAGIDTVICAGLEPDIMPRLVQTQEALGTLFPGMDMGNRLENRKKRILTGVPAGTIVVDIGARNALVNRGRSLLPPGITRIAGHFDRGDTVLISVDGHKGFARGITRYSSAELAAIKGHQSSEISGILGYDYGNATIHRNDMILL